MSDTGLQSGVYHQVREYAELVDSVLIDLKSGAGSSTDATRRRLAEVLIAADEQATSPRSRLFRLMVLGNAHRGDRRLGEIGRALLDAAPAPGLVARLEEVAQALERERISTFSKMRGRP